MSSPLLNSLPTPQDSTNTGFPWDSEVDSGIYDPSLPWPKITIVTPSYNQGKYIEETIRSILLQNYPNLEYIIMDGGSTDESVEIIKKYEKWITHWESKPDRGQTHAINKGFKKATGKVITWLNSDDTLLKDALFHIGKAFLESDADFIHFNGIYGDEIAISPTINNKYEYIFRFPYMQPACFYRRKVIDTIGYLDERFDFCMDHDFFFKIHLNFKAEYIPRVVAIYRLHDEAKSSTIQSVFYSERKSIFANILYTFGLFDALKLMEDIYSTKYNPLKYTLSDSRFSVQEVQDGFIDCVLMNELNEAFAKKKYEFCQKIAIFILGNSLESKSFRKRAKFVYLITKYIPFSVLKILKR